MLSFEDMTILDFERASWREPGPKDQAIELGLGLSAAVYYERLLGLIDDTEAMTYDPLTVRRLRRLVEAATSTEATGT